MVLKEAYRYQNYLDRLIAELRAQLITDDLIKKTKETHLLSKADPKLKDDIREVKSETELPYTANDLINAGVKLITEKEKLSLAISNAKKSAELDIDSAILINKAKQSFISTLSLLDDIKDSEKETIARGYTINNEGNQVELRYTLRKVTTIDFDRSSVKGLIKKYKKETNDISTKKDLIDLTTNVEYETLFDVDTSFEDVIVELVAGK